MNLLQIKNDLLGLKDVDIEKFCICFTIVDSLVDIMAQEQEKDIDLYMDQMANFSESEESQNLYRVMESCEEYARVAFDEGVSLSDIILERYCAMLDIIDIAKQN